MKDSKLPCDTKHILTEDRALPRVHYFTDMRGVKCIEVNRRRNTRRGKFAGYKLKHTFSRPFSYDVCDLYTCTINERDFAQEKK